MAWRASSALRRPAVVAAAVAAVAGTGGVVYYTTRPTSWLPQPIVPLRRDEAGKIQPPTFQSVKSRAEQLAELRRVGAPSASSAPEYDLLIIGGGATGAGIALDAATRGLKVAVVERDDFAAGTSSKSTKLVHGGVRYLEKAFWNLDYGQLELVIEALGERKTFLEVAPHLSSVLPILLPLKHWWQAPYFWVGTKMYDVLAGSRGLTPSYYIGRSKMREMFPLLRSEETVGGLVYCDGQQNDARMNVSLALTAMLYGATVVNHAEVTALEKDASGKICGARVRDVLTDKGEEFVVRAKGVVNATGPFSDGIEHLDDPKRPALVVPSSGAHVILPGSICPTGMGLLDASTSDGRVVFVLPWEGHTLVGTTDSPCAIEKNPVATDEEISFILKEVSKLVSSDAPIAKSDILAAWSGIRPLVRDHKSKNTESLVRSHIVTVSDSGLLTCAGGKWTTYRSMAEDAVDKAIEAFHLTPRQVALAPVGDVAAAAATTAVPTATTGKCLTQAIPLIGAHGFSHDLPAQLKEAYPDLDASIAQHLAYNYGDRAWTILAKSAVPTRLLPDFPITEAEVRYGVQAEAACTAVDIIARRTRLAFVDVNAAVRALPRIVEIMGEELGWSAAVRAKEISQSMVFLESMGLKQCAKPRAAEAKAVQYEQDLQATVAPAVEKHEDGERQGSTA